jgi:hypothetical protein
MSLQRDKHFDNNTWLLGRNSDGYTCRASSSVVSSTTSAAVCFPFMSKGGHGWISSTSAPRATLLKTLTSGGAQGCVVNLFRILTTGPSHAVPRNAFVEPVCLLAGFHHLCPSCTRAQPSKLVVGDGESSLPLIILAAPRIVHPGGSWRCGARCGRRRNRR